MVNHIIESQQFDKKFLDCLFKRTDEMRLGNTNSLKGKVLTTLFYEPSTRTRLSFESAMFRLGGSVIGTENAREFSSSVKGESLEDSIRVIAGYSDAIVMRHYETGSAKKASLLSSVPIINAGDGKGQHPTQSLLDIYTLYKELGRIDDLKIAMVGDLAYGRTIHSLCYLLSKYSGVELNLVSPKNLKLKPELLNYLRENGLKINESDSLEDVLGLVDAIYMTRIQKERMSEEDYSYAKGKFVINEENLNLLKPNSRILHPLPHVEEISLNLETEKNDPRVAYFRQAKNGLYTRMALLEKVLLD